MSRYTLVAIITLILGGVGLTLLPNDSNHSSQTTIQEPPSRFDTTIVEPTTQTNMSDHKIDTLTSNVNQSAVALANTPKSTPLPKKARVSNGYTTEQGTLDYDMASKSIKSEGFNDVLTNLFDASDEQSILTKMKLTKMLDNINELAQYNYEHECGKGICAIAIEYVKKSAVSTLKDSLIKDIELGASLVHSKPLNEEYAELRVIVNQNNQNISMQGIPVIQ